MNKLHFSSSRSRQAGFTLVEMMVAMTIGLVVIFGMTATFVNLKSTFKSQDSLGQLQDNERLALTFLTTAVNEAGYYPNPMAGTTITNTSLTDNWSGNMPASVGIFGTADGGGPTNTESLQTAFSTTSTDGLISCIGTSYAGAGTVTVRNVFYVDPTTNSLMCKVYVNSAKVDAMANAGTPAVLISGVKSMSVAYGLASSGSQIASYKTPGNLVAANWPSVKSVRITLVFVNPFDAATPITRTHTINLMN
jgi:type IV pilus assembly protein PilW